MSEQEINLKNNLTMLTDFYELTMANGYFENGFENTIAYFDMFFRKVRMAAALPLWPACSRWWNIWKT